MDYKLAKQLMDAGFEYSKAAIEEDFDEGIILVPTLEELIDACGNRFGCLTFYNYKKTEEWEARDKIARNWWLVVGKRGKGKTPKIAVAKLWLELVKEIHRQTYMPTSI